ncbi:MAG TPA: hypothetical protein EYQ24_01485 [Bacteroidetes bacterium]|nr:hypothetical protein [Bacteroidota bacterium]HIL58368.1 hypothetical protein [Rhodothermales bacterium]
MKRFFSLSLALALGLTACAEEPETDPVVDDVDAVAVDPAPVPDTMAADTMAAAMTAPEVSLDGTLEAAGDDITAIPVAGALDNINGWIARLDGAEFTNAAEIREGLMTLRDQLQNDPLDGAAIGETLTNLGDWTAESAPDNDQIQALASALQTGGAKLTGM